MKLKGINKLVADYESDLYKRDLTEAEKKAIWDTDKRYLDTDLMIEEIHKRTKLPLFICTMVYYAEGRIMQDVGLMT